MRFVCVFLTILLFVSGIARAEAPEIQARGAVLIDGASGRTLYALNADELLPMASTTKIMTALIALDELALDEMITVGPNAARTPGTSLYLSENETLSAEQMLEGLLLRSGNDAAIAIAEHVSGSVGSFCARMNERALALNANAHFENPHGLDAQGHEASALAMALIAREALSYPDFRRLIAMPDATIPWAGNAYARALRNKNKLLRQYEGATGVKTGFTKQAGRCLVFSALRDGWELIGCVLNCGEWFDAAARLLDWGFASYTPRTLVHVGETVAAAPVANGLKREIELIAAENLTVPLGADEACEMTITLHDLVAPILPGAVVGKAFAVVDGNVVHEIKLLAASGVRDKTFGNTFSYVFDRMNPAY